MSQTKMNVLTPEQEALIPGYREKWRAIAFSTEPLDREKAELAIIAAYDIMGKKAPKIIFCPSPYEANLNKLASEENMVERMLTNFGDIFSSQFEERWRKIEEEENLHQCEGQISLIMLFFANMRSMWSTLEGETKNKSNPLIFLNNKLGKIALEGINNIVDDRLPQEMSWPEMRDYMLQITKELGKAFDSENENSQTGVLEVIEEMLSTGEELWWCPKRLMKCWLESIYAGTMWKKVAGVNWVQLEWQLARELADRMKAKDSQRRYPSFRPMLGAAASIWLEFCFSVLQIPGDLQKWNIMRSLVKECGWIFADDEICLLCDRPRIFSLDSEGRLHGEGEPAIQFADGYSLYAHHGLILPEKYGAVHPERWQAQWLLEEENAELRRVLIQTIGYGRICQDLQATELDAWREYSLLRIEADVDDERIHLLKMTCPSTGYIHVMRVPPYMRSAREAIKWVNWGVDPEEFSVQS